MDEKQQRLDVCAAAQQLWLRGLLSGSRGLVAVESHRRRYLVTPPGRRRAALLAEDLVTVDLEGRDLAEVQNLPPELWQPHRLAFHYSLSVLPEDLARGNGRDIHASVLAHPPQLTALVALHPGAESVRVHQHPPLPAVWGSDERMLRSAIIGSPLVLLPGVGVLSTAATVAAAVSALEEAELAATVELELRRQR